MRILVLSLLMLCPLTSIAKPTTKTATADPDEMVRKFAEMHQQLMPIVAVADMFYGCNISSKQTQFSLQHLIYDMDKDVLATKLSRCLGDENIASDKALNFGLQACLIDQMSHLQGAEKKQRLREANDIIKQLPRTERQKSFTQCVNNQTLKYLRQD
ncbi:hypothetical protein [Thalassotalea sp. ND16A]|uniref:hypothetical protein n=1 Tax=Thalassotalea sp. ND16A TaxID=1535422 RepID=UPI00051A1898|nr:hypothetical protein [Thalassotalea sp. ND16A]KGJ98005.1 hypothetical protein ND16A_0810 [Thalassotalea sp. ND16A]